MPGPLFLDGDTVSLRTIETEDLSFLQEGINDPRIRRSIDREGPANRAQEREFFEEVVSTDGSADLLVAVDGKAVGMVGLQFDAGSVSKAELGYWIAPDHHRQGYASEAVELIVEYGFEQRALHRIEARVFDCNDASRRLLETVGFRHEGTLRDAAFVDGSYRDTLWYGLLADEYE